MAKVLNTVQGLHLPDGAEHDIAYTEDGKLFVATEATNSPAFLSTKAMLERLGCHIDVVVTDHEKIKRLHDSNSRVKSEGMQQLALEIFREGMKSGASDIHITVGRDAGYIHFTIDGDFTFIRGLPKERAEELCSSIYNSICNVAEEHHKPHLAQEGNITEKRFLPDNVYNIRLKSMPLEDGYQMVLRLIYSAVDDANLGLVERGYSIEQQRQIELMKSYPNGLLIISGPTGSGKSSTMANVLTSIVRESNGLRKVMTIEDPPEYPIQGTFRIPVSGKDDDERRQNFNKAIVDCMRMAMNIVMVGEIRDASSAEAVFRLALTGHYVFSTLHTNDALSIFDRLLDIGIPMHLLADHTLLRGMVAQRLIKLLCAECKVPIEDAIANIDRRLISRIERALGSRIAGVHVAHPGGCTACNGRGFKGRTAIAEVIPTDPELMDLLRQNRKKEAKEYWLHKQHGTTLYGHALDKIASGLVDPAMAEQQLGWLNMESILEDGRIVLNELLG